MKEADTTGPLRPIKHIR